MIKIQGCNAVSMQSVLMATTSQMSMLNAGLQQSMAGANFGPQSSFGGASPGGGSPFGPCNNFASTFGPTGTREQGYQNGFQQGMAAAQGGCGGGGIQGNPLQAEMAQLMSMMMQMLSGGAFAGSPGGFAGGPSGGTNGGFGGGPFTGGASPVQQRPAGGLPSDSNFNPGPSPQLKMDDPTVSQAYNQARQNGNGVQFTAGMNIDSDGSGSSHGDRCHQNQTSMRLASGQSLNADSTPYVVLPPQLAKKYHVKMGDLCMVRHGDKVSPAIFGDVGPRNKLGEGSTCLAQNLGINSDPNRGGTSGGVEYTVFPGSGRGQHNTNENTTTQALWDRIHHLNQSS